MKKISSNEELIAILEDFENIDSADTNGNKIPETTKPAVKKKSFVVLLEPKDVSQNWIQR